MADELDLQAQYRAAQRVAANAYRVEHPAEYRTIVADVTKHYRAQNCGFARCMVEVEKRAGRANGLPEYDVWASQQPTVPV